MLSLLTSRKSFGDRWVGHAGWNTKHDLHARRMRLAEFAAQVRRATGSLAARSDAASRDLDRDGFAVLPDFLPDALFQAVSEEAEAAIRQSKAARPLGGNAVAGFGAKQPFPGGFDRWDGGTLNRFLDISTDRMPATADAIRQPALHGLTRRVVGLPHHPGKTQLYLTANGDDETNYDVQRDLHRDTFFSAMKFWLFLRPVTAADGPFTYVPGSHRLTPERLQWERRVAMRIASSGGQDPNAGGSFRIGRQELAGLNLPEPVACACPANTLVIANTMGLHARGRAEPDTERLSLYGWRRPFPFGLLGR